MNGDSYRPPTLRAMAAGCLLTLLVLVPLVFISSTVKYIGLPFLLLPRALGLLPRVPVEDLRPLDLSSSPNDLDLPVAGGYLVYCEDFDLLDLTLQLEQSQDLPWLRVAAVDSGAFVPVAFVERGLMPYDPIEAPGRPIFRFVVPRPGVYRAEHLRRDSVVVVVVPDVTTGAELEMLLAALLQAALLVALVQWLIQRRRRAREARMAALLAPGRLSPKDLQRRHAERQGPRPPET